MSVGAFRLQLHIEIVQEADDNEADLKHQCKEDGGEQKAKKDLLLTQASLRPD